jgi:hypothetical protein
LRLKALAPNAPTRRAGLLNVFAARTADSSASLRNDNQKGKSEPMVQWAFR